MKIVELIAGAVIALATLLDVFGTVVIPGRVQVSVGMPAILKAGVLPAWRSVRRLVFRKRRDRIPTAFAGFLLLFIFITWIAMLMVGLALMLHALGSDFRPPIRTFTEAMFQAGAGMTTIGAGAVQARGWGRLVVILCGLGGLQVVTLTLTYIVQLQMALQNRDPLVLRLATRAGAPPSAVQLLLTQKKLGLGYELATLFDRWEQWTADVQHTHKAHPILAYFRSDEPHGDWVTALGVVLDAAVLAREVAGDQATGHADLLIAGGTKTAQRLCMLLRLKPDTAGEWGADEFEAALETLAEGGFSFERRDGLRETVNALRSRYAPSVDALALHFGVEAPALHSAFGSERGVS